MSNFPAFWSGLLDAQAGAHYTFFERGVVQKAPFLSNTDTRFPHHAEGDFVVKTIKPEVAVAPSHR